MVTLDGQSNPIGPSSSTQNVVIKVSNETYIGQTL
jgi:hypothetical protein